MSALVKIRSERDQLSAIERRIADFMLDNAHLLRDYSSQQLANALGISQSSVVKFSQKLGFKGYPDLKLSVSEALVRADNGNGGGNGQSAADDAQAPAQAGNLWQRKSEAEEATRLINPPDALQAAADAIGGAGKVCRIGMGDDDIHARMTALRLSQLGILAVHNFDAAHMASSLSAAKPGDVLLVFSEHGMQPALAPVPLRARAAGAGGHGDPPQRQRAARAGRPAAAGVRARRPHAHRAAAVPLRAAAPDRPHLRDAVRQRRPAQRPPARQPRADPAAAGTVTPLSPVGLRR